MPFIPVSKRRHSTLIGLLICLSIPVSNFLFPFEWKLSHPLLREAWWWIGTLGVLLYIRFVERADLASIGLKPFQVSQIFSGLLLGILLFLTYPITALAANYFGLSMKSAMTNLIAEQHPAVLLLYAARAAITEEIIFRGYAITRLFSVTRNEIISCAAPTLLFTLLHASWGVGHLLYVFACSLLLAFWFCRNHSLLTNIIGHFVVDFTGFILLASLSS